MPEKYRTLRLSREEAARLYRRYAMMQETERLPEGLPDAAEINGWREATLSATRLRESEILNGPAGPVSVEMLYEYPRDMVNLWRRLAGEPEE